MMFAVVGGKDGRALGAGELDKDTITKAYGRWAPVYDLVFGAVFDQGRRAAIAAAERIGGRILEVGVGTGISLPDTIASAGSSVSIFPKGCCARRRSGSASLASATSRGSPSWTPKTCL